MKDRSAKLKGNEHRTTYDARLPWSWQVSPPHTSAMDDRLHPPAEPPHIALSQRPFTRQPFVPVPAAIDTVVKLQAVRIACS